MSKYINADEQERIMQKNEMIESNDWVEVVRCKGCKYYDGDELCLSEKGTIVFVTDDDYCSKGEREETN